MLSDLPARMMKRPPNFLKIAALAAA